MASGAFHDDPFGAPAASQNPFSDPSVQHAVSGSGAGAAPPATTSLDDYNPFDKQHQKTISSEPAVVAAGSMAREPPPAYTPSAQQKQFNTADFERRQEELEQRARELERREQELRNGSSAGGAQSNNWPPLPSFCPLKPCFYQDITVDIPVEFQKIVRYLYYMWIAHVSLMFTNAVVGLLYLFAGGDKGGTFGLALVYFVLFTPASFMCWFRTGYKAFRDDSSFNFMVFFFIFFFQFLFSVLSFLGIGSTGSCGLIVGIAEISGAETGGKIFVGVLMLMTAIGFGVCALADFFLLVRIHRLYRSTGASMAKAQAEFTSGVMKNESVQRAAAEAARETARGVFAGDQPSQQSNTRY